jgi:hypothetical protein
MNNDTELRRLRYATANFFGLQGLRQVAVGVMLVLLIPALGLADPWNKWLFLLLLVLLGICWWRLGVYYEHRFGEVHSQTHLWSWPDGGSLLRRAFFWGCVLALYLVTRMEFHISLGPSWFLGFLFVAFFVVEGRPWYYLLFAAPFFATAAFPVAIHPRLLAASLWFLPFAFILTGVLDHRMLVRSFPGVPPHDAA